MSTILQKYGAGIASLLIVLMTAVSILPAEPSYVDLFQLLVLGLSGLVMFIVPLVKTWKYAGALKILIEVLAVIIIALIPFFANGVPTREQWILIGIAVLKAAATQLGIIIRTDVPIITAPGLVLDPASVTNSVITKVEDQNNKSIFTGGSNGNI